MKKRFLAMLLCLSMVITLLPAITLEAQAQEATTSSLASLGFNTNTKDMQAVVDSGVLPLSDNTVYSLNTISELLVSYSTSTGTNTGVHTVYDSLTSDFNPKGYPDNLPFEKKTDTTIDGDFSDAYFVRTAAVDVNGDGRKNVIAQVYATIASDGSTVLGIRVCSTEENGKVTEKYLKANYSYLPFTVVAGNASAYLQIAAGDYDGDGKEEIAIYNPNQGSSADDYRGTPCIEFYEVDLNNDYHQTLRQKTESRIPLETAPGTVNGRYTISLQFAATKLRNPGENKKVHKNFARFYPIVDLACVEQVSQDADDLALTVSCALHADALDIVDGAIGNRANEDTSYLSVAQAPMTDKVKITSSKLYFSWRKDYGLTDTTVGAAERMMFPGVDSGDLDGDGHNEIIVAGYRLESALPDENDWDLSTDEFLAMYLEYDSDARGIGIYDRGLSVPQWLSINKKDYNDSIHIADGIYNGDDIYTLSYSPLQVTCFAERGNGYGESALVGGLVVALAKSTGYGYNGISDGGQYPSGYKAPDKSLYDTLILFESDGFRVRYALPLAGVDANSYELNNNMRMIVDATAGVFDDDLFGREQLIYTYVLKANSKNEYDTSVGVLRYDKTGDEEVGNRKWDDEEGALINCYHTFWRLPKLGGQRSCVSIAAVDVDRDSTLIRYSSGTGDDAPEFMFADPYVLAVLQAAPYFDELVTSDYTEDTGSTAFSTSKGTSSSTENEIGLHGGITFGFDTGILGTIAATELSSKLTIDLSAGYTRSEETSTTYSTGFQAVSQDSVALVMTPAIRYHYEAYNPTLEEWEPMVIEVGQKPQVTHITVDQYDAWAAQNGKDSIRDTVLDGSVAGDPTTYMKTAPVGWMSGQIVGDASGTADDFIRIGTAGGSVSMGIESEKVVGNGVTWGVAIDWETESTAAFVVTGWHLGAEYSGSYTRASTTGTSFEGEVADIPSEFAGDFSFQWKFGSWKSSVNGNDCVVLGYLVKNVKSLAKPPQDLHISDIGSDTLTLAWSIAGTAPSYYEVYRYLSATDSYYKLGKVNCVADQSTYAFTDTELEADSDYTYAVRAYGYQSGMLRAGLYSPLITGHTNASDNVPVITQQPEDLVARAGDSYSPAFRVGVTPVPGGSTLSYQWQSYDGQTAWANVYNATGSALSLQNIPASLSGTQYRCLITQKIGGKILSVYSNAARLFAHTGTSSAELSLSTDTGKVGGTIELTATVKENTAGTAPEDLRTPTGTVEFRALNLDSGEESVFRVTLNRGEAVKNWKLTYAGSYRITAVYNGDLALDGSTSASAACEIAGKAGVTVAALESTSDVINYGDSFTLTPDLYQYNDAGIKQEKAFTNGTVFTYIIRENQDRASLRIDTTDAQTTYEPKTSGTTHVVLTFTCDGQNYKLERTITVAKPDVAIQVKDITVSKSQLSLLDLAVEKNDTVINPTNIISGYSKEQILSWYTLAVDSESSLSQLGTGEYVTYLLPNSDDSYQTNWLASQYNVKFVPATLTVTPDASTAGELTFSTKTTDMENAVLTEESGGSITAVRQDTGFAFNSGANLLENTVVTLTASAKDGYTFYHWEYNESSYSGEEFTHVVNGDANIVAVFRKDVERTLTFDDTTMTASVNGEAVASGDPVKAGRTVTLTAVVPEHMQVSDWTVGGDSTGKATQSYRFVMPNQDTEAVVAFSEIPQHTITISAGENGSVSPSGEQSVYAGDSLSITATPASDNYYFAGWTVTGTGGSYETSANPMTITNISEAGSVAASFLPQARYMVVFDESQISATADGAAIRSGELVDAGKKVEFTALLQEGQYVSSWSVNGSVQTGQLANTFEIPILSARSAVTLAVDSTPTYTVTASAGAGGTITPAGGTLVKQGGSIEYTITANAGYEISDVKLDDVSVGKVSTYTVSNVQSDTAISATFTSVGDGGGSGSGGGGGGGGGATVSDKKVPVLVDGVSYDIGTAETESGVTTVTVDQVELQKQLAAAKKTVVIPITSEEKTVAAQLIVDNIEKMAKKEMTLSVTADGISYDLPANAIDTAELMKAIGAADSKLVSMSITIKKLANGAVTLNNGTLVVSPVRFTVTASYHGKTVEAETFDQYVRRVIAITAEQAARITTGVVAENGTERHVPTNVYQKNGKWYAEISSLTNSTYALIHNEQSFTDDDGKWYEAVATEMASRQIINGRSSDVFDGDANITRAEFAAILVRALGLPADGNAGKFSDISQTAWCFGAIGTAYEYGIVNGKDETHFDPNASITREEAMAMVYRASKITELAGTMGTLDRFSDAGSIHAWALDSARWNVGSGLIQGNNAGMICGQDNITRGETATIILRLLQKSALVDVRTKV